MSACKLFTPNYQYILQGIALPRDERNITFLFAKKGDSMDLIDTSRCYYYRYYNIPTSDALTKQDALYNPPSYQGTFVVAQLPYLAFNEFLDKTLVDKYGVNDIYKCFIKELATNRCRGGILIIPLNFWSSSLQSDAELRRLFLRNYKVLHLNIFEEQIFNDKSVNMCAFQFQLSVDHTLTEALIDAVIYPSGTKFTMLFS